MGPFEERDTFAAVAGRAYGAAGRYGAGGAGFVGEQFTDDFSLAWSECDHVWRWRSECAELKGVLISPIKGGPATLSDGRDLRLIEARPLNWRPLERRRLQVLDKPLSPIDYVATTGAYWPQHERSARPHRSSA